MAAKFENVDVLDALERIVDIHTRYYREDFDLDKELLSKMAASDMVADRHFIWLCRPCGTHSLRERDCYLEESRENKVLHFYLEQTKDPVLAYAVELTGVSDGKVMGNIYELDYPTLVERSKLLTCPIHAVTVSFEDGHTAVIPYRERRGEINRLSVKHGGATAFCYAPESERELMTIVLREHTKRSYHATPGDIDEHITALQKGTLRGQLREAKTSAPVRTEQSPKKGVPER